MVKVFKVEDAPKSDYRGGNGTVFRLVGEEMGAEKLGIVMLDIKPGFKTAGLHYHPGSESVFFVIEGTGTITAGEKEYKVGPGSVAFMAPSEIHAVTSTGKTGLKMMEVFTPIPIKLVEVKK